MYYIQCYYGNNLFHETTLGNVSNGINNPFGSITHSGYRTPFNLVSDYCHSQYGRFGIRAYPDDMYKSEYPKVTFFQYIHKIGQKPERVSSDMITLDNPVYVESRVKSNDKTWKDKVETWRDKVETVVLNALRLV